MRSPSPEPDADTEEEPSSASEPSPPVRHNRATAARAAPGRQGQQGASVRHADHNGPGHDGTNLAAKLSVNHERTTAIGSGVNSVGNGSALAEQSSALPAVANKEAATRQDAGQQTVTISERPVPDKHDASVQSEGPVLPDVNRQPRTAVPTGERGTQTPIGHASPRPLQKAPPGRDPQWSPPHAAPEVESRSRAQADSYSLGPARAGQSQGNWPARQSPPTQWTAAAMDPFSCRDSVAAQGDAHSIFTSPAPEQLQAEYTQQPAQRLFCSPPPAGEPAMQPPEHTPAEQQAAAFNSQAQQQDTEVHRSAAEAAMGVHHGYQDADHPPAGTSNNPAEASPPAAPAGVTTRSAQHTVGAAITSSSNPTGPATATPTQAQAGLGSAALPYMADPSLQPRGARVHAHLPSHVPWVPQQQAPPLLGGGYAYMQSLPPPVTAHPAVLHADPRGVQRGLGPGQRTAAAGAPVGVMQRQQGSPGMYGLPRYMYPGASLV